MARNMYGATSADFTVTAGGRPVPSVELTIWSARTGGTQITDLLDVDSAACTTITSGADGSVVFYGPDGENDTLWLESGIGSRLATRPTVLTAEIADGSILDEDINAAADIARSKIAGTALTAASMGVFNVLDYGAVGDGATDDSAAIRSALTAGTGAVVYFPEGTYKVTKDGSNSWCLNVPAGTTVTGPGVVKLADTSDEWVRVFYVAANNVVFDGLGIDGNKANNTTHEHRHGIMVTGATGVSVRNCRIVNCTGDGVLFEECTEVEVTGCHFEGHERNGVTLYADTGTTSTSQARITDNYINCAVQPVDSEPEGTATVDDVTVTGNTLVSDADYGITLVGGSKWTVTGNTIVGGVYVIGVDQATIGNNVIDGTVNAYAENSAAVDVWGDVDDLSITGNTIKTTKSGQKGIYVVEVTGHDTNIIIASNTIRTSNATGIETHADSTIVTGNVIMATTPTDWTYGVKVYGTAPIKSAIVSNNSIHDHDIGVGVEAYQANDISHATVIGNFVTAAGWSPSKARCGFRLDGGTGGTHLVYAVVANNSIDTATYWASMINPSLARLGFYGTTPVAKQTVTGSRGSNAALASLCTALANLGLITNSTT